MQTNSKPKPIKVRARIKGEHSFTVTELYRPTQ